MSDVLEVSQEIQEALVQSRELLRFHASGFTAAGDLGCGV